MPMRKELKCNKEGCTNRPCLKVDGKYFCTPHYEEYYYNQKKGVLDWEGVEENEDEKSTYTKQQINEAKWGKVKKDGES